MANTKISALTANTNPNGNEEFVYAYNNANGKITLDTVKAFIGGAGVTTLNADANIWELNEGTYVTTYDLYYKSGEAVPHTTATGVTLKQMIFVVKESTGERGYFVFNEGHLGASSLARAGYGVSNSSSVGYIAVLGDREYAFEQYGPLNVTSSLDAIGGYGITHVISNIYGSNNDLRISTSEPPRPGLTYTLYIDSVASGQDYSIILGNGVTNPFNITLPTNSTKKCLITVLITSSTTGIVTGCTIEP